MKFKKAFTLVEILVVTTIIGLLAAVGAASYSSFTKQSRDAKRKADLEQVRSALEMYRSNNSTYPGSVTFGGSAISDGTNTYIQKTPKDPKSTQAYYYVQNSSSDYTIGAYLEGGNSESSTTCGSCTVAACNYCMGPLGLK